VPADERGARWQTEIAARLHAATVGIICLTPSNLRADWLLFEAGALSKTLENARVCTLLLGLEPADVTGPLAQFQSTRAVREEMKHLLQTINSGLGASALPEAVLAEAYEVWWPKLEEKINALPEESHSPKPPRDNDAVLDEIRSLVWALVNQYSQRDEVSGAALIPDAVAHKRKAAAIRNRLINRLPVGIMVEVFSLPKIYDRCLPRNRRQSASRSYHRITGQEDRGYSGSRSGARARKARI
jgi:hypothetical protein